MPISQFDRSNLRDINIAIQKAFKAVEQEFGVSIKLGGGRFTALSYKPKIEIGIIPTNAEGKPVSATEAERLAFARLAPIVGLKAEDYNTTFTAGGRKFTIVEIQPRRRVSPIIAKSDRGTRYKFKVAAVLAGRKAVSFGAGVSLTQNATRRSDAEIIKDLRGIECQLSPENLTADGERPRAAIQALAASLNRKKIALQAELGRIPTDSEIYG